MRGVWQFVCVASACLLGCSGEDAQPTDAGAVYYGQVERVLQAKCQSCHSDGGIAPFALESFADAKANARAIAAAVRTRTMPPWPPSARGVPLKYDRSLSDDEIALVSAWVEAGAQPGSERDHVTVTPELPSVRPDLELAMPAPYRVAGAGDESRCFVLDPRLTQSGFVTGLEVRPQNTAIAHHATVYQVPDAVGRTLAELSGADGQPGYACFSGKPATAPSAPGLDWAQPLSVLGSWKPGHGAEPFPSGTGVPLAAGWKLVLEMHYFSERAGAADATRVHLELARSSVAAANVRQLNRKDFSVPALARDYAVSGEVVVGQGIQARALHAVFPHMHLSGSRIEVTRKRAADTLTIIDIPRWDFHWQGNYLLREPVTLESGDVLAVRCVYDNPSKQAVAAGDLASDEMCVAHLYVVE